MRVSLLFALILTYFTVSAQSVFFPGVDLPTDRAVLLPAETMPRFPGCEESQTVSTKVCSDQKLLEWIEERLPYPEEARERRISGLALVRFIVTKEGKVSDIRLVYSPGEDCGEEALRVVNLMRKERIYWIPGTYQGKAVSATVNLPIWFRPADSEGAVRPQLLISLADGERTRSVSREPVFRGNLKKFFTQNMMYPRNGDFHCEIYDAHVNFIVSEEGHLGDIQVDPELPEPFQREAERLVGITKGQWNPALYNGKPQAARHSVLIPFRNPNADCVKANVHYLQGRQYYEIGHYDGAREAFRRCVELNPRDIDALLGLGLSEGHLGNLGTACSYFTRARRLGSQEAEELWRTYCH